jgi:NADPH:quinone reductase-like Zn-dependent oxidoreductase
MKVVRLADSAVGQALVEANAHRPRPGRGELLIRVGAAGVTPTELMWYPTSHTRTGEKRTGAVPGHEFSGVVAEAGEDAGSIGIGQEVFGMNGWFSDGATAEYCVAHHSAVAPKPHGLTHAEAASVPIGALTSWQGLFDRAKLQPGERVLVHGGAGAVGIFAVQLALLRGARVTATASARDIAFVSSLGAEQVIDYRTSRFEDAVQEMDVVFDTVGGETLERSWNVLRPVGRMVTIAASEEIATDDRVKKAFFIVEPNQKQLTEIGGLLDAKRLRAFVAAAVPLSRAAEAYTGSIQKRGVGKVVVVVATVNQLTI